MRETLKNTAAVICERHINFKHEGCPECEAEWKQQTQQPAVGRTRMICNDCNQPLNVMGRCWCPIPKSGTHVAQPAMGRTRKAKARRKSERELADLLRHRDTCDKIECQLCYRVAELCYSIHCEWARYKNG